MPNMSNGVEDTQLDRMKRLLDDAGMTGMHNTMPVGEHISLNLLQEDETVVNFLFTRMGRLVHIQVS